MVGAALAAQPASGSWRGSDRLPGGPPYYHLPRIVPVLSRALFGARLAVEVWLFELSGVASLSFPTSPPLGALEILIALYLRLGGSFGLPVGRGFAIRRAYLARSVNPQDGYLIP